MTTLPSERLAEIFPAVPSTRPRRNMSLAAASTADSGASTKFMSPIPPG
ncbi:Uncharacterised protein [Mycobacterium tuberculosis]|nr:Uncharacterised protein [Mycobacterium tuberculosis]